MPSGPIQGFLSGEIKAPSPRMVDPFNWLLCDLGNPLLLWTNLGECWVGGRQWPHEAPRRGFQAGMMVGEGVDPLLLGPRELGPAFLPPPPTPVPSIGPSQWCELSATL